jgi:hypothetical protein
MSLTLNATVEGQIANLANIPAGTYDPGSLSIALINGSGPTTLRYTVHVDVDSLQLIAILKAALP